MQYSEARVIRRKSPFSQAFQIGQIILPKGLDSLRDRSYYQALPRLIESHMVIDVVGNIGSIGCVKEEANR